MSQKVRITEQTKLPRDYFYYRFPEEILLVSSLFSTNPYGFNDYLKLLRYRSGIRRWERSEVEGSSSAR